METYAQKMCSFRGRMKIEEERAKQKVEAHPPVDPFFLPLSRVRAQSTSITSQASRPSRQQACATSLVFRSMSARPAFSSALIRSWPHCIGIPSKSGTDEDCVRKITVAICASSLTSRGMQNRRRS